MDRFDTLLFDLDGTLTDSRHGITRCLAHALEKGGLPSVPDERLEGYIGTPLAEIFVELGSVPEQSRVFVEHYRERYRDVGIFENTLYPEVAEVLSTLEQAGYALYLATSKPTFFAKQILEHFEIDRFFSDVFGSELDGRRVDKTEILCHARDMAGFDLTRAVMVGDRKFDMEAARGLRAHAVGALWGYGSHAELSEAGAEVLLDAPRDLAARFAPTA